MAETKLIQIVAGTRPEVIKLAPVYLALQQLVKNKALPWKVLWISTGQHREMVKGLYQHFTIEPDVDLEIMRPNQTLTSILTTTLLGLADLGQKQRPDLIIGQGDTTSAMAAGLFAFQERIPFAHIEAGLRTYNLESPFPEEFNRRILSLASRWHFAPTPQAKQNLLKEGVNESSIIVTGNTSIDALLWTASHTDTSQFQANFRNLIPSLEKNPFTLVTLHRRENWGPGVESVISFISNLAQDPNKTFLFPMHLNPMVRKPILDRLSKFPNVILLEPLGYAEFCWAMKQAQLIITDSGGVQEEALSFATPMIITRENTERPEALSTGLAHLCGTDEKILNETFEKLWGQKEKTPIQNPFGDGKASQKIAELLIGDLL